MHAVQRLVVAASAGMVWEAQQRVRRASGDEESKPRPHICANGEERGAWAERLLSDCGCGPMNLSACLPVLWRVCEMWREACKASKQQATVRAQAYVQELPVVTSRAIEMQNAKLKKLSCCDS